MKTVVQKGAIASAISLLLSIFTFTPAQAAVPQAPGFSVASLKVIVDNDYAAFMGSDSNVTRLFNQNNVEWMTQIANAASLDIYPQVGETYIYIAVMGGGGTEDWSGTLNGQDVVTMPGAQVASGRSPLGTASVSGTYLRLESFVSGYGSAAVAAGTQNVTLAQMQTALTGVTWSSAVSTGYGASGNVPTHKTSGVCCGSQATGAGLSGKGWNFPSDSLVVFRYPLSALSLPVRAGNAQVIVDWNAPGAGDAPTGYIVQYKKTSDPDSAFQTFSTTAAATTVATVTGLTNGVNYSFRVAGTNASGTGTWSAVRDATPKGPPPAPTALIATAKASSAEIAFTNPESDGGSAILNYEYTLNDGSTWIALSPLDATTPVTIPGLTDGVTYAIKLRAISALGAGTPSQAVSVVPGLIARLSDLTFSNAPAKGIITNLTISLTVPSRVSFFANGKRIAGCYRVTSSGIAPSLTASCAWKPTVMSRQTITVVAAPIDNSYANGNLTSSPVQVVRRTNQR